MRRVAVDKGGCGLCALPILKRVYIVGAARSGTTLLNRMLILSGYFADYRAETLLLSVASRRYGKFGKRKEEFLKDWYRSRQFKRSGVDKERFERVYEIGRAS